MHELDELAADREPEPGAAELARHAAIGLLESFEDALLLIGCDADARIGDGEFQDALPQRRPGRRPTANNTAPDSVNLTALLTRLPSTWRRRIGSP